MALDRDITPRTNSFNSSSTLKSYKPRELRVDYHAVPEDAKVVGVSHSDVQISTQPIEIGLIYCAPKLKGAVKVAWTTMLIIYTVVVPVLVLLLYRDLSENVIKIDKLQRRLAIHLQQEPQTRKSREGRALPKSNKDYTENSDELRKLEDYVKTVTADLNEYKTR